MISAQIVWIVACAVLVVWNPAGAVVNKASSSSSSSSQASPEEEKQNEIRADERISNYGPPPSGAGSFKGPAPVYGPAELVGEHGPAGVFPPIPADVPPAIGPPHSFGPIRKPPVSFGVALGQLGPKGPGFGPQKLHLGPVKHLGPPPPGVFGSFRPPKPQYGPPLKLTTGIVQHPVGHGPGKPGHGLPIPVSLETYGPPPAGLTVHFNSVGGADFGHGPPSGDLHGPPPRAPPPGVPAPPTPPDIKYDGWQPIAGLQSQHGHPAGGSYGAPLNDNYQNNGGSHNSVKPVHENSNSNIPSDSYGVPIHNAEAQNLKSSVHQSSSTSESNGLPPPPLPQLEPLHNEQKPPRKEQPAKFNPGSGSGSVYGPPALEPLDLVKTVQFELLPGSGSSQSLDGPGLSSYNQLSGSFNNEASFSGLDFAAGGDRAEGYSYQSGPNDISSGKINVIGLPLAPPPPIDSYSAPPPSSYSANGPYPASQAGRASSSFVSAFGLHGGSFHKQIPHRHRPHGSFRPPPPPPGSLSPPRTRDPIKFREPIPAGLLTNLHRYLPAGRPVDFTKLPKTFVPAVALTGQQLPTLNAPVPFHQSSGSFARGNSHSAALNSAIAAPHVQYGTPLSFVDFNTPAPILTYGAPNFGPAGSFGSTSIGFGNNLYNNLGSGLTSTYGTPVVNGQLFAGFGHDCGFQQTSGPAEFDLDQSHGNHLSNLEGSGLSSLTSLPSLSSLPSLPSLQSLPSHPSPPAPSFPQDGPSPSAPSPPIPGVLPLQPDLSVAPPGHELSGHPEHQQPPPPPSGPSSIHLDQSIPSSGPGVQPSGPGPHGLPDTAPRSQPTIAHVDQNELFKVAVQAVSNTLGGLPIGPSINHLGLQQIEQQKTDLKDSYGNPVGITFDTSGTDTNDVASDREHAPPSAAGSSFTVSSSSDNRSGGKISVPLVPLPISAEALTASLTMQGFGEPRIVASNEVDPSQFLKTDEGSAALSLVQGLAPNRQDGFQIQGSKGTYTLQIQPADGGLGTENSDGTIRHEQVLSNGLLQDILQAIEHPEQGPLKLQGLPEPRPLEEVLKEFPQAHLGPVSGGHFITQSDLHKKDVQKSTGNAGANSQPAGSTDPSSSNRPTVALFFNSQLGDARKNTRSVVNQQPQTTETVKSEQTGQSEQSKPSTS